MNKLITFLTAFFVSRAFFIILYGLLSKIRVFFLESKGLFTLIISRQGFPDISIGTGRFLPSYSKTESEILISLFASYI